MSQISEILYLKMSQNVKNIWKHLKISQNISKCLEMSLNVARCRNISSCFDHVKMWQNLTNFLKKRSKMSKYILNMSKNLYFSGEKREHEFWICPWRIKNEASCFRPSIENTQFSARSRLVSVPQFAADSYVPRFREALLRVVFERNRANVKMVQIILERSGELLRNFFESVDFEIRIRASSVVRLNRLQRTGQNVDQLLVFFQRF